MTQSSKSEIYAAAQNSIEKLKKYSLQYQGVKLAKLPSDEISSSFDSLKELHSSLKKSLARLVGYCHEPSSHGKEIIDPCEIFIVESQELLELQSGLVQSFELENFQRKLSTLSSQDISEEKSALEALDEEEADLAHRKEKLAICNKLLKEKG